MKVLDLVIARIKMYQLHDAHECTHRQLFDWISSYREHIEIEQFWKGVVRYRVDFIVAQVQMTEISKAHEILFQNKF